VSDARGFLAYIALLAASMAAGAIAGAVNAAATLEAHQ
jgi:hypothetical protein